MAKPPVSEQVQVNFRMPVDLRDRIRDSADDNGRSMTAEIVAALEEKYPAHRFSLPNIRGALIAISSLERDELMRSFGKFAAVLRKQGTELVIELIDPDRSKITYRVELDGDVHHIVVNTNLFQDFVQP